MEIKIEIPSKQIYIKLICFRLIQKYLTAYLRGIKEWNFQIPHQKSGNKISSLNKMSYGMSVTEI